MRISKTTVDHSIPRPSGEYFIWDDDIAGFGLRVYASGKKTYVAQYRFGRRTHRLKLGTHGALTPDEARKLAKKALGDVAHGRDPAYESKRLKETISVSGLCDLYLAQGCATKRTSTLATDRGRIERHIKPLLGRLAAQTVQRPDIEKFLKDIAAGRSATDVRTKLRGRARVRGGKGTASRTVGLLGAIFTFAQNSGLRDDNPVRGVKRFKDRRLERFLSSDELLRLGVALNEAQAEGERAGAIAAIHLLALTGCRRGEVMTLRWREVHRSAGCLVLPDSKTGHKIVPLGTAALDVLDQIPAGDPGDFVFPGQEGKPFQGIQKVWERVRAKASLNGVRLHDLRHTFVSVGVASGLGLTMLGKIVGHRSPETTARYAHVAKDAAHMAADAISSAISNSLLGTRPT
jgi:integrase